ncbi:sulfate/molybdate ABC transporter ATP-binding protein [Rhizobium halophytocola]|uniref:Sulfate transport system ATP-binding protein n=1 Tax=Rhizobium halophytocola TaxID=735519 RepID=A0ABS4DX30_9HYPH|nr:sulfate/molybdate ABC transporter ATP-binding protein [Rhizobium halophytocola]MBP1850247.1 sulfate transport system ATP-binding protein [Rhizobium halophytocola]
MDVTIKHICKDFGAFPALDDVSLNVGTGELIALLGPSGSGKTTLLRLIAGLEQPTSGQIFFGSQDASYRSVQERHVGFVFQHYALFRNMRVEDNIAFGLKMRPSETRPSPAEIRRRVEHLIDMVQLTGMERRYPSQLSGGQRQRVALARALAIEPTVLLLDEPFGALDAKVRKELRRWLKDVHQQTGHTTFFVTHDQEEALELADRVVVMNKGRIEQVGSADEVYDRPNSPFVFSFIGESSSVPVTVRDSDIYYDNRPIALAGAAPHGQATLFFRPQDVEMAEGSERAITGKVIAVRRLAGTRIAEIDISGNLSHSVEIEVPLSVEVRQGAPLSFRPTITQLFQQDIR